MAKSKSIAELTSEETLALLTQVCFLITPTTTMLTLDMMINHNYPTEEEIKKAVECDIIFLLMVGVCRQLKGDSNG